MSASTNATSSTMLAGRYVLGSRIAVGGMGEVYAASDDRLGRQVAVKVLKNELAGSGDFVERFRREAVTAARLTHPSVAQVLDYGQDGRTHFIVMELVEGTDLARILQQRHHLPAAEAAEIAAQVCGALSAAHHAGFVHRDIKPGNVIVQPDGSVKVTDFGIARALAGSSLTQTGTIMGTAQYLAPEQVRGEPARPASDLYAVGVLLYQMLTGKVPFDGESPIAIAMRHVEGAMPRVSATVPEVPRPLDDAVARATALSPEDRFVDADDMAASLRLAVDPAATAAATAAIALAEAAPATSVLPAAARLEARAMESRHQETRAAASGRSERRSDLREGRGGRGRLPWVAAAMAAVVAAALTVGLTRDDEGTPASSPTQTSSKAAPKPAPSPTPTETSEPEPAPGAPTMPADAVGRQRDEVVDQLVASGATVRWVIVRAAAPEKTVIGTVPAAGEKLRPGQTAVVVVSRGEAPDGITPWTVPDWIVGSDSKKALSRLDKEDVRVSRVTIPSSEKKGSVVATWPAAGQNADDGVVVLVISGGGED